MKIEKAIDSYLTEAVKYTDKKDIKNHSKMCDILHDLEFGCEAIGVEMKDAFAKVMNGDVTAVDQAISSLKENIPFFKSALNQLMFLKDVLKGKGTTK